MNIGAKYDETTNKRDFAKKTFLIGCETYDKQGDSKYQNGKYGQRCFIGGPQYENTATKTSCTILASNEISILYLSSESAERIKDKINAGIVSRSIKRVWREKRRSCLCTIKQHPIEEWRSSYRRLLKTCVMPFMRYIYRFLLKEGVNLALDFIKEDRAIQTVCDRFNKDSLMRPYVMTYSKFFDVRREDIEKRIKTVAPRILHIAGHGTYDHISFADNLNKSTKISAEYLSKILNNCVQQPELVFFATCNSHGIAERVVRSTGIKVAVGIKGVIENEKVVSFSRRFYGGIAQGKRISEVIEYASSQDIAGQIEVFFKDNDNNDIAFVNFNIKANRRRENMQKCVKQRNLFTPDSPLSPIEWNPKTYLAGEINVQKSDRPSKLGNYKS